MKKIRELPDDMGKLLSDWLSKLPAADKERETEIARLNSARIKGLRIVV